MKIEKEEKSLSPNLYELKKAEDVVVPNLIICMQEIICGIPELPPESANFLDGLDKINFLFRTVKVAEQLTNQTLCTYHNNRTAFCWIPVCLKNILSISGKRGRNLQLRK